MFIIQVANNSRTYQTVSETEVADSAIYSFIQSIDAIKSADSIRIVDEAGTVMARKTPKGSYICSEWTV